MCLVRGLGFRVEGVVFRSASERRGSNLRTFSRLFLDSQGHNLALNVLYVPIFSLKAPPPNCWPTPTAGNCPARNIPGDETLLVVFAFQVLILFADGSNCMRASGEPAREDRVQHDAHRQQGFHLHSFPPFFSWSLYSTVTQGNRSSTFALTFHSRLPS